MYTNSSFCLPNIQTLIAAYPANEDTAFSMAEEGVGLLEEQATNGFSYGIDIVLSPSVGKLISSVVKDIFPETVSYAASAIVVGGSGYFAYSQMEKARQAFDEWEYLTGSKHICLAGVSGFVAIRELGLSILGL